jgi:peptidoglycan/xylan/chitin deacetylase (PgdA/CDA1 family)
MRYDHTRPTKHLPFRMVSDPAPEPARPPRVQARGVLVAVLMVSLVFVIAAARARMVWPQPPALPPFTTVTAFLRQPDDVIDRAIRAHKLLRGHPDRREVALTFDDGPHPVSTRQILSILRAHRVKATFFVVGSAVRRFPDVAREIVADGHSLGNHTEHHVGLRACETAKVYTEISQCNAAIAAATGEETRLFRPPGGTYDRRVAGIAAVMGYTLVQWTANPGDYRYPGTNMIAEHVIGRADNGAIVLLHDNALQTMQTLSAIIETLQADGYTFVTVDEMLERRR